MKIPLLDLKSQYTAIKDEVNQAIQRVLESCQFVLGPDVRALEEEIAAFCATKYAAGVASGTDALTLSLHACGVGEGDEVITTPFTFIATIEAISKVRAKAVFVDIEPRTYNLDVQQIEDKITDKTKAILPVHLYGQMADMDPILTIAKKYELKVIEDMAQSLGAEYKGRKAGSRGDAGCISFFPSKNLGAYGDGGMVITDDEEIAERIKVLRVHGCRKKYYHFIDGYNSRLDTLQAAVLRVKLKYLNGWNEKRRQNSYLYNRLFKEANLTDGRDSSPKINFFSKIVIPCEPEYNKHVYYLYTIRARKRDELQTELKSKGISTAIYYPLPLHLQEVCRPLGYKQGDFPVSEHLSKDIISLPMYPELSPEQIEGIVNLIATI